MKKLTASLILLAAAPWAGAQLLPSATALPAEAADVAALQALPGATSVLLQRGGSTLVELYARDADPRTLHDTRSATKSVTAMLVAAAVQDGFLAWDTPVFDAFEALKPFKHDGPAKRAITVEDLVTMSSALDCNDWDDASPGNEENMYPQRQWLRWTLDLPTRVYARDTEGRGPFAYCTAGVFLLGQLLDRKVPGGLEAYQGRRLFAPLGITAWEWKRSDSGEPLTGGGLRLKTRDLAALSQLLLQRGRTPQRQQLIDEPQLRRLLSVQHPGSPATMGMGYGHLFWQRDFETRCGVFPAPMMSGNGGNIVALFPTQDINVVLTRTHYNQRQMHPQSWAFIEGLIERHVCIAGKP